MLHKTGNSQRVRSRIVRAIVSLATLAVAVSIGLAGGPLAHAQSAEAYPAKPIRLIVGFPPGQATDVAARIYAEQLGARLGQPVVVENRPGQGGSMALAYLKNMPADGYTIGLMATASLATNPHLYKSVGYDPLKDFEAVSIIAEGPLVLVAHPRLPVATTQELIAYARERPGKLNYCSPGNGTLSHLAMEDLKARAGISLTHVPYQGSVKAMADLVGGNVDVCFDTFTVVKAYLDSGRLKALGVATPQRLDSLPNVPGISESGIDGFVAIPYIGIVAPSGTPRAVINRLYTELAAIQGSTEMRKRLLAVLGAPPVLTTPAEFEMRIRADHARFGAIIRKNDLKPD